MEQLFFNVKSGKKIVSKDVRETNTKDRKKYYKTLTNDQMVDMLELFVINYIAGKDDK